jgi:hypothetical protein
LAAVSSDCLVSLGQRLVGQPGGQQVVAPFQTDEQGRDF